MASAKRDLEVKRNSNTKCAKNSSFTGILIYSETRVCIQTVFTVRPMMSNIL